MSEMNELVTPFFALLFAGCLIGIFLIARWIYFDAKSRGMNPWPWVLLTTLFSPNFIGVLIYILARTVTEKSIKCNLCNVKAPVTAKYCPNCGAKIDAGNQIAEKRASNRSLIAGIVLILIFTVTVLTGIIVTTAKSEAENPQSAKGHSAVGYVSSRLGNKWECSFKTLNGVKSETLKAKSERPVLHYSSEITKGTIVFELYEKSVDTLIFSFPSNNAGQFDELQQGRQYYIVARADQAGGNFLFKME